MSNKSKNRHVPEWVRLDNAAKIYPSVLGGHFTGVFRLSVTFRENILYSAIVDSIPYITKRFPYYCVTLKHGLFWLYLERSSGSPRIYADHGEVCEAFPLGHDKELMYRFVIKEKTLSVEFLHILTDGGGAMELLKTLIWLYLRNSGKISSLPYGIKNPWETPLPAEYEDSFSRYYDRKVNKIKNLTRALHLPYRLKPNRSFSIVRAEASASAVLAAAKRHSVSATAFMTAVYLSVLQEIFFEFMPKRRRGNIRVQVPVNLRKIFPSDTMRNFSLFVMPELKLNSRKQDFSTIIKYVDKYLRTETNPQRISRIIRRNVAGEKNTLIRVMPVFIKKYLLYFLYNIYGAGINTGVLTNIGRVDMPRELQEHIQAFEIIPPPPNKNIKVSCGIATFEDKMRIVFGSIAEGHQLERAWFRFLINEGIDIKLM